jgi:hypothetical protein
MNMLLDRNFLTVKLAGNYLVILTAMFTIQKLFNWRTTTGSYFATELLFRSCSKTCFRIFLLHNKIVAF